MESQDKDEKPKKIMIQGQTNKYWMKKLTQPKAAPKPKKAASIASESMQPFYLLDNQPICLQILQNEEANEEAKKLLLQSIQKKISAYKQQDKKSGKTCTPISLEECIQLFTLYHLHCYYCHDAVYLLYTYEREPKQWTLDRIDNSLGHSHTNVVLCCLQCNLKRRTRSHNAFLFTKQTKIVKQAEKEI
jgi:hypothetical protein